MASCNFRYYRESDRKQVADLFGDPEAMRFVGNGLPLGSLESKSFIDQIFEKYRADPSFFIWAIEEDGQYAGHAELKRRTGRSEYEIIYILERARWGRGLGGAVIDRLLEEARNRNMGFVIATVSKKNYASTALLLRRKFQPDETISAELGIPAFRLVLHGHVH